jgi:hypothetical protein
VIAAEPQNATPAPSHLQAAAPFLLTAAVLLVAAALSLFVIARARTEYEEILSEYEGALNKVDERERAGLEVTKLNRTSRIKPEYLAELGNWLIDGGGMFASLMGPLIGLAILYERIGTTVIVLYTAVILFSIASFALFVSRVPPSGYPGQPLVEWRGRNHSIRVGKLWIFTPVVTLTAVVNLTAGVAVLIAGP